VKAALFAQGGGMRAVYSLAVLARLEELGLTDRFDVVEGASAGAINGAYFVAGQAAAAVGLYASMARAKEFIRYARVHRILDVDFLIDTVLKREYPLHVDRYWNSAIEMRTIVTNAATAEEFIVTNRSRDIDVYELFRATAAIPVLYHKKIVVAGTEYIDGGVSRSLPALADLARRRPTVAILTRPLHFRVPPPSWLLRRATGLRSRSMSVRVHQELRQNYAIYNTTMAHLEALEADSPIRVVAPSDSRLMASRTTRDPDLMLATVRQARLDLERSIDDWHWL
jgi:predicted patatin/cPLA2 family phospholipase